MVATATGTVMATKIAKVTAGGDGDGDGNGNNNNNQTTFN